MDRANEQHTTQKQTTMAERFVELYRQWEDLDPSEVGADNLSSWMHHHGHIGGGENQVAYLQSWNVRPIGERTNQAFESDLRRYAVMDFHDGSYAFSPSGVDECYPRRRWLAGRPS